MGIVLLIDEEQSYREMLASQLRQLGHTVYESSNQLRDGRGRFDVILIGVGASSVVGESLAEGVMSRWPDARMAFLSSSDGPLDHAHALDMRAAGIVSRCSPLSVVLDMIARLIGHQPIRDPHQTAEILFQAHKLREERDQTLRRAEALTLRELDVVRLLGCGLASDKIATELGITLKTYRNYVERILRKLQVNSKLEAVVMTHRAGVIQLDVDAGMRHGGRAVGAAVPPQARRSEAAAKKVRAGLHS